MKSGRFCDLCRKEIAINNMIPMEIQGENYVFDSYDCIRIFHNLNAAYGNILDRRVMILIGVTRSKLILSKLQDRHMMIVLPTSIALAHINNCRVFAITFWLFTSSLCFCS